MDSKRNGWIGVDLDRTLAVYHHGMYPEIGEPVPEMLERVKRWLSEGWQVRIVTARVDDVVDQNHERNDFGMESTCDEDKAQRAKIEKWCLEHIGQKLMVTNRKDYRMICLYDDRAVTVSANTGGVYAEFDLKEQ
jgi:hypothetical protein